MDINDVQAQMDLATKSAKDQRERLQAVIDSQLDAGDRILLRKSADTVLQLAQVMALTADPTT